MYERDTPDMYFTPEHLAFRKTLRAFVSREIIPNIETWEDAGRLPRSLYKKAGDLGVMGALYPEDVGGIGGDLFFHVVVAEELARCGAGGVAASLGSHSIGTPPLVKHGTDALKQKYAVPVIAGDMISALAVTEPGGGSDVAALRTKAVRDGDHYVISGEKTFITSGMQADVFTVAVRTDPTQKGAGGISFMLVPGDTPGLSRTELKKMGWLASDTAHLVFDQCRVPVDHLIGVENEGFKAAMLNFNNERLTLAIQAYAMAQVCYQEALEWAQQRHAFGAPISQQQVIRHKLVDMAAKIDAARCLTYDILWRFQNKMDPLQTHVARSSMAKVTATDAMKFCADEAVQILGGMGFMRGTASERIYREVKVMTIGGGTDEVMKNLAASQLGI